MSGDTGPRSTGDGPHDRTASRSGPPARGLARFGLAVLWRRLLGRYRPERNYMRGSGAFPGVASSARDED